MISASNTTVGICAIAPSLALKFEFASLVILKMKKKKKIIKNQTKLFRN